MRTMIYAMIAFLMAPITSVAIAGDPVLVIVNPNAKAELNRDLLKDIFLGTKMNLDGRRVIPVDQDGGSLVREKFYHSLIGKGPTEMKVYWAEQVFSGKARAPRSLTNDQAVIQEV